MVIGMKKEQAVYRKKTSMIKELKRHYWLYLFLVPGLTMIFLFKILPFYGVQIAFRDFNIVKGIWDSPWVGLKHFRDLLRSANFLRVLKNSIITSILRLIWGFPMPILLALFMNEMRSLKYKKTVQTIIYMPHFLSWAVVIGIVMALLSQNNGVINSLIKLCGGKSVPFLTSPKWFRTVLIGAGIWKESGWGTVVYMAALAGISPELYEAATMDGATRMQKMRYITLPCILGTVSVMLIMSMGSLLNNGFEQIWMLQNSLNKEVAEVLETYSYQVGLREGRYSFSSAIGLSQSIVGCILVFGSNFLAKRRGGSGLW